MYHSGSGAGKTRLMWDEWKRNNCMYHSGSGAGKTRLMWDDGREIIACIILVVVLEKLG